ncbi:MAG: S41 family peptidase [Oscillospiraceae bacterium]|nr:S41 family peptidase [Oscillospiraceae bacterium]
MKKTIILLLSIAALATLYACSPGGDDLALIENPYPQEEAAEPSGAAEAPSEPEPEMGQPETVAVVDLALLARDDFLYDFDYMMLILEENFPMFGVVYRKLGVDLQEKAALTRAAIANEPDDIGVHGFFDIMQEHFFSHAAGIGFLALLTETTFLCTLVPWIGADETGIRASGPNAGAFFEAFSRPESVAFYGEFMYMGRVHVDLMELAEALAEDGDEVLRAEILDGGKVAYIRIPSALGRGAHIEYIRQFMEGLYDAEHLILDFRGVRGEAFGHINPWMIFQHNFYLPHLSEPIDNRQFLFLRSGQHSAHAREVFDMIPVAVPVELGEWDFPCLNESDSELFGHAFSFNVVTRPPAPEAQSVAFDGNIWLLIDDNREAVVESIAWFAKLSEKFILVGEAVGARGSTEAQGTSLSYASMPNSGIILRYSPIYVTDQYGRNLEEIGIMPHHFNRDGMDAFETTLALIAEGAYQD